MNENFEKLYKYLYDNGSTTLGRDEFYGIYASEPDQYEKLYGHLLDKGLTTLSSDAFYDEYFGNQKKKKRRTYLRCISRLWRSFCYNKEA